MQTMVPSGADKIWAEDSGGDLPTLLLLHEGVGDARMWDPVWSALISAYRVIRYEVRGFGRSPGATENYTLIGDALAVLDHFAVTAVHVVGCSMGGGTAIQLALTRPDQVMSLVLLCPGIPGFPYAEPDPAVEAQFESAAAAGDADGLIQLSLQEWGRSGDDPMVTELMRSAHRASSHRQQRGRRGADPRLRADPHAWRRPLPDGPRAATRRGDDPASLHRLGVRPATPAACQPQ